MSFLIDDLVHEKHVQIEVGQSFYIAKPLCKIPLSQRLKDALNVLYGNARAFHYFEDEANTWGEVK